ncbi:MAG: metal ABC transporter permease [Elusimicrobia bacterium]|nr:metal ABC transporter permease [Elusimicrobiota bacterium]
MSPSLLLEVLRPDFLLRNALYGCMTVGLVCPLVGVYFLLRRMVFWGVALPQVSAAGLSLAFLLQGLGVGWLAGTEPGERHLAIMGSAALTAAAILALVLLERRKAGFGEGRLGALYAASAGLCLLFVSWNPHGETAMLGLLKGEIVAISGHDLGILCGAFAVVAACFLAFQREFLLVSFDRDTAEILGRKVLLWEGLLYALIGVTVSLGVMTAGPLVIFGFLVLPAMAALPWARGIMSLSLLASLTGGASAFIGFLLSYAFDLPLGPVAVCLAAASLGLSSLLRLALHRR